MYDIKAEITNLRETDIFTNYRPAFKINEEHCILTTGEIKFIECDVLKPNEKCMGYVNFISPEHYPHFLKTGDLIYFYEGKRKTGFAIIQNIYNKILIKP